MKRLVSLMFAIATLLPLCANPVGRNAARHTATLFAQEKGKQLVGEPRVFLGRRAAASCQPLYVFNMANEGGFVIVSGNDKTVPILGYTTDGSYDEEQLPDNFRGWLESMALEVEAAGEIEDTLAQQEVENRERIEPLIKTKWSQGAAQAGGYIYNMLCPVIDGKRALTGCVATAGAQIMYHYQHPKDSIGGMPLYRVSVGNNEFITYSSLDSTVFKWDDMKLEYTSADQDSESAKAVSELMLYCGYAAHMNYDLTGSAANEAILAQNMVNYLGYDPYTWKSLARSSYTIAIWDELIYSELAAGHPVIYSGTNNKGGHTFICDGYDGEGLYHINWGWGGNHDGYFALYAANLDGIDDLSSYGFIYNQTAILGLQPATGVVPEVDPVYDDKEAEEEVIEGLVATARNLQCSGNTVSMTFANDNDTRCAFGFGLGELKDDGQLIPIDTQYAGLTINPLNAGGRYTNLFPFTLKKNKFEPGEHKIVPICILAGETEWKRCRPASSYFMVRVEDDSSGMRTMEIDVHPLEKFTVNSFEMTSPGLANQIPSAKISVTNEGDFLDKKFSIYLKEEGKDEEKLQFSIGSDYPAPIDSFMIKSGGTKNFKVKFFKALPEGHYTFNLKVEGSNDVLCSTEYVIGVDLEVTGFTVVDGDDNGRIQQIDVTVNNHASDFISPLYLFASRTEEKGECVYAVGTAIESGKSQVLTFYFVPDSVGDWNFWLALDEKGENVVYHEAVSIGHVPPEEEVDIMDVNSDGEVTLADVAELSGIISSGNLLKADINGDGRTDISDLISLIRAMLPAPPPVSPAAGWPAAYDGVMLQAFYWDSFDDSQWTKLESMADELAGVFDLVWLPQSGNCGGRSMGYDPLYWFNDYNSSFGNEQQLRSLISTFREKGIKTLADVVINHRRNVSNWVDFPSETYNGVTYEMQSTDIVKNDDDGATLQWATDNGYQLSENDDTGEGWNSMRDLDHKSENVQTIVKAYLDFLKNDLGYAGFRYDMVKGYAPSFVGMYNVSAQPEFSVGECWDSSETIKDWMEGTKEGDSIQSAAFDFQFKYVVRNATDDGKWNKLGEQNEGNWPLVSSNFEDGNYHRYAVTFVENHDTQMRPDGSSAGPLLRDTLAANAYMMAMPGTPCVFLPHWLDYAPQIKTMVAARRQAGIPAGADASELRKGGINSESTYVPFSSSEDYYATITLTDGEARLLAVVGDVEAYEAAVNGQWSTVNGQWTKVTEGYHYAYYFPTTMNVPYADLPSGKYVGRQQVMLSAVTAADDAMVVYTLDGSEPTDTSTVVPSGTVIPLSFGTTTLKAAILTGGIPGEAITRTYEVVTNENDSPVEIPAFCTVTEGETCAFFESPSAWTGSIVCWAWDGFDNFTGGVWPGQECELLGIANSGHNVWKWTYTGTLAKQPEMIIFSSNGSPQTIGHPFQNGGYYTQYGLKGMVE